MLADGVERLEVMDVAVESWNLLVEAPVLGGFPHPLGHRGLGLCEGSEAPMRHAEPSKHASQRSRLDISVEARHGVRQHASGVVIGPLTGMDLIDDHTTARETPLGELLLVMMAYSGAIFASESPPQNAR